MTRRGRHRSPPAPPRPRAGVGAAVVLAGLGVISASEPVAPPRPQPAATAAAAAVAEARAALDRGDADAARAAIGRALAVAPDDADARGLARRAGVPLPPDRPAVAGIRGEAAGADLAAACDDARFLLAGARPREAATRLEQAIAAAGTGGDPAMRRAAAELLVQARAAAVTDGEATAAAARRRSSESANAATGGEMRAAASIRAERLARIADLRHRGHVELALAHCRRLMTDLPADAEVEALFRDLLDEAHQLRRSDIAERDAELRQEIAASIERSLIPEGFDGMPIYPSDWGGRHLDANALVAPPAVPEWKASILDRLSQRVSVQLDASPIADALALIGKLGGINVVVAPDLQASDKTVTLHANAMQLEDVLSWCTEQAGAPWSVDRGAVFVGQKGNRDQVTVLHDISALLSAPPDFTGPNLDIGQATGGAAGGGGGGFNLTTTETKATATPDDIADLIKRSVSPRIWTEEGNAIAVRGTALWITAPDDTQRMVGEFLRAQSEQHALAVHMDLRWLELSDTFVEEIGVEWRSKASDLVDGQNPAQSGYLRNLNSWSFIGGTSNALPASSLNAATGAASPGLTLQAALVGSSKLSAVLNASEVNSQGRVLQAPDLSCLNGQRAYAFYGQQIAYISDYQIVSSNYDPTIKVLNLGSVIDIRPLVSADRRYVTFDLRATTSSATLFTEYIGAVYQITSGNGTLVIPGAAFPLELPNLRVEQVGTSVMVPDRGSLLVGGFRHAIDQFSTSRVPLLGSVPFLGRLFGARGRYAQRSQLYLLTTVTILNYPELEARL